MKKRFAILLAALCVISTFFASYAEVTVAGRPSGESEEEVWEASYVRVNSSGAIISDTPYTGDGPSQSSGPSVVTSGRVGADHESDPAVTLELGFTVVSPAVSYGGFKVAEGSVQLSDGSWASIGYDKFLRFGYYKLLREERDSTGVDWYVVAAHASDLGDYNTPDGTVVTELWLKKSDCTAASSVTVRTTDETRLNIVRTALSLLGSAYQYGASGPDSFDCSGFVTYVLNQNGITGLPRSSTELCSAGREVGISGLRPGDIVGRAGHVGIYIGDGWFVHSSQNVTGVICESVDVYNQRNPFTAYRSVVD